MCPVVWGCVCLCMYKNKCNFILTAIFPHCAVYSSQLCSLLTDATFSNLLNFPLLLHCVLLLLSQLNFPWWGINKVYLFILLTFQMSQFGVRWPYCRSFWDITKADTIQALATHCHMWKYIQFPECMLAHRNEAWLCLIKAWITSNRQNCMMVKKPFFFF